MNTGSILEQYIDRCHEQLLESEKIVKALSRAGVTEQFVLQSFRIGLSDGTLRDQVAGNDELIETLTRTGILGPGGEILRNRIIIPVLDEDRAPVNLVGVSLSARSKKRTVALNVDGVFNAPFLRNTHEVILTEDPIHALVLICHGFDATTFVLNNDEALGSFATRNGIRQITFTFEGKERLFANLASAGIVTSRRIIDLSAHADRSEVAAILSEEPGPSSTEESDTVQPIDHGFIFRFSLLHYRVIGSFSEHSLNMKVNIKAFTNERAFVDSVDLYKNRERERFIYNLIDRFDVRDQVQLEADLTRIADVIEKHRESQASQKERSTPALTDHQKDIGMQFLTNPKMLEEIEADYTELGYVQERKNKILLYLVMTSRLTESPLHAIAVSRSGAGKSHLAEITAELCPPEDLQSVSDLSAQALYYYGQDDLRHTFIVIGEKAGSDGADYPLRELISRKSITKAIPMKDPASGQIRTETITVEGPIALVETTTSSDVNPENLNRCFVLSIDETEAQTRAIHEWQRKTHTLDGLTAKRKRQEIIEKHIYAQRLLNKVTVITPFAELLTFPSGSLRSRRDNEKLLRLISSICFLHQHQRPSKRLKLSSREEIEYIESTVEDYRIAYELLADGVLENTLDDLPRPARQLFQIIHSYLDRRAETDGAQKSRIIFERKEIREYCSWSFAQVRNNIRILSDYEYLRVVNGKDGTAKQYRLSGSSEDPDFMSQVLSPEALKKKLRATKETRTG